MVQHCVCFFYRPTLYSITTLLTFRPLLASRSRAVATLATLSTGENHQGVE